MKTVGVFDSGVGGLSVLQALLTELPGVRFVYLADNSHAPYGERSALEVKERSGRLTAWLRTTHRIDALVVACNTATALAIDDLRATHPDLPIVGVEPALKPAVAVSRTRSIGVLATRGTLQSERFARLRQQTQNTASSPVKFVAQPCDGLADAIERNDLPAQRTLCGVHVQALLLQGGGDIDTVVLGCTHYPFAADLLSEALGPHVTMIDTGPAVARRTRNVMGMPVSRLAPSVQPWLYSTGDPEALSKAAVRWLGLPCSAQRSGA